MPIRLLRFRPVTLPTGHSFESLQIESDARRCTTPDEPSLIQAFRCPGIVL